MDDDDNEEEAAPMVSWHFVLWAAARSTSATPTVRQSAR